MNLVFSMFQLAFDVVTQEVDVTTLLLLSRCLQSMSQHCPSDVATSESGVITLNSACQCNVVADVVADVTTSLL